MDPRKNFVVIHRLAITKNLVVVYRFNQSLEMCYCGVIYRVKLCHVKPSFNSRVDKWRGHGGCCRRFLFPFLLFLEILPTASPPNRGQGAFVEGPFGAADEAVGREVAAEAAAMAILRA